MGFFGGLLSIGGTLALDTLAALASGSSKNENNLANKSFRSDAYGTPISRCRGTVRVQGKVWDMSKIRATVRKTTGGGLFGIGQKSVRYNLYSASIFVGFAEKLGGGAASRPLRLWADGKLLYNGIASDGSITGAVTVTVVTGGQQAGSFNLLVNLASGAHLKLNPTDLITVPGDPQPYEVQTPIDVSGPKVGFPIPVWPPLRNTLAGGGALTLPGINSPVWDLSSFDPDPHDGSHFDGGYDCPPGGATFYLGSDDQEPDPTLVKVYGAGNVPGYRGRCAVMLRDLQLRNYGDRPPDITGLWAFDDASTAAPLTGPIADESGTTLVIPTGGVSFALPSSGPSSSLFANPLQNQLPYVWVQYNDGTHEIIARINVVTNQLEAKVQELNAWSGIVADAEGFVYQVGPSSLNHWDMYKWDGLAMTLVKDYGPGDTGANEPSIGQPGNLAVWESQQSLFGNPVKVKLLAMLNALGGINFWDANSMTPFGAPTPGSPTNPLVEYETKSDGSGIFAPGSPSLGIATPYSGSGLHMTGGAMCVDRDGNVWICQNDKLSKYDCQFTSGIDLNSLKPVLFPPSFNRDDFSIASVTTGGATIYYNAADNSILILSGGAAAKFDIATATVLATGATFASAGYSAQVDIMGTVLGATSPSFSRLDVSTLQVTASYNLTNFLAGAGVNGAAYDQQTDSLWFANTSDGKIYRAYLDRGNGQGVGLDAVVSSLMEEVYDSSEFDVTGLTTAAKTVYGVEFTHEPRKDSLAMLEKFYQFDHAEIDGKVVFVQRGQAPIVEIPEDDLGSLDDPSKYEPRLAESVQDEYTLPELVRVHYYDPLKQWQQCTQEAKRNSQPYPSSLAGGATIISTQQQRDITVSITENATPIKQQALMLLWEEWARATERKGKLPYGGSSTIAYWRLDPTDVVNYNYKGALLETMLEEADFGAGFALEASGHSQDRSVYSSANLPSSSPGLGSGTPPSQPPVANDNYIIDPVDPLSSPNSTTIEMAAFIAKFTSGLRTSYAARNIANGNALTVPDPGAGNSAIYYVTISDPNFTGDQPVGTASLTVNVSLDPAAAHVGETGFINAGAVTVLGSGATTTTPNPLPGGQPPASSSGPDLEIAFGPTAAGDVSGFKVAHGLGSIPSDVQIQLLSNGNVFFQALRYDAQYVYLTASDAGISGYLEIWE